MADVVMEISCSQVGDKHSNTTWHCKTNCGAASNIASPLLPIVVWERRNLFLGFKTDTVNVYVLYCRDGPTSKKIFFNLKDNALQDSLVADICGLVQVEVEQCYCCSVWIAAEIFRFLFDNFADLGRVHLV